MDDSELTVGGSEMENELIGITGVFVLTFCFIALYHFIGLFGRKTYRSHPKKRKEPDRRPVPRRVSATDYSWLLWGQELDPRDGPPRRGFYDQRETKGSRPAS